MTIAWNTIISLNNSQNNAFEELVCQLARDEFIEGRRDFYRIAAPDGGVEAYCVLNNGDEYGWQAKYFSSMGSAQWSQLKGSFETALRTHPNLKKYYICIPLDRQDPRIENQMWFMDHWNQKVQEWSNYARSQNRDITFEYWGSSELIHRLSQEKHCGRRLFWFSQEDFSEEWFRSNIDNSIKNLGKRYTPELNIKLEISNSFDALSRNDAFRQNLKDHFHAFLVSINKTVENLERHPLQEKVVQINKALKNLEAIFYLSQKAELIPIEIESINKNVNLIRDILSECETALDCQDKDKNKEWDRETYNYSKHWINKSWMALHEFSDFFQSPTLLLANCPIMLLLGPAGIGKSHLLADICLSRIRTQKSCILLLGQHFTSRESPWKQILDNLLRIKCNEKEFLGALNAKAEAMGQRILLCIDAINEGQGRYFWPDHIRGFINDCSKYPWIGLVLSVRSSYENLLVPENLVPEDWAVRVTHHGFSNLEYRASSFFFSQYEIEQPRIPLLHPEFTNPLFLKLFCEGLHRAGQSKIPTGYSGITSIINFFLENVDQKLSTPSFFDYPSNQQIVRKVINGLIDYKLKHNTGYISYEKAFEIADNILSRFSNQRRFLDALISEGVFSKNLYWSNENECEEGIYLAYERFEDHLTTAYLLDNYLDEEILERIFIDGNLAQYVDNYYNQGILESLSIQVPERFNKELHELLSEEKKARTNVVEAFINSLLWRKTETINGSAKEYINKYVLSRRHTFDLFIQMVYSVSSDPEHFFNADFLHRLLLKHSLADLDAIWTTYISDKDYEEHSIQRLINWALSSENKNYLSDESRLLVGKALAWLFSSTNVSLRDEATQALTVLFVDQINSIKLLLSCFETGADPYVYERILAAAYGAILHSGKLSGLEELSEYIVKAIFKQDEVYTNVLVRDYARNIVEYALYKGVIQLDDPLTIRPPYKSCFPKEFPSNEDVDAYKFDYDSESFKDYYWSQNAILSSMVTEYGRGICCYGDFGRYTFQSALDSWAQFDPNDLSNYACKLIFEKYGYNVEKHGKFDRNSAKGDRHTNRIERIGKKYQWLALYEVLARVSDNYRMIDESTRWQKNKDEVWFQGPWEPFVRNIDPTCLLHLKENSLLYNREKWWNLVSINEWADNNEDWLIDSTNLPNPEQIIALTDGSNEWLTLEKHIHWEEPIPIGKDKNEFPHKYIWYQVRSYLVCCDEYRQLVDWAKKQHFMGRWFPEGNDQYQVFSREYYWSPAYRFFDNPYFGRQRWKEVADREDSNLVMGKVLATSEGHSWESGSGDKPTYLAPSEFIFTGMNLQYSNSIGEWLNGKGDTVCFDPSINQKDFSCLIIKKDELTQFLQKNDLKIFWTVLGRKEIHGEKFYNKLPSTHKWLEISGVFELNNNEVIGSTKLLIQGIR